MYDDVAAVITEKTFILDIFIENNVLILRETYLSMIVSLIINTLKYRDMMKFDRQEVI